MPSSRNRHRPRAMLLLIAVLSLTLRIGTAQSHNHLPAEWTPHNRTLMAWPDRVSVYTDDQLHRARSEVAAIAEAVARFEPVWLYSKSNNIDAAMSMVNSTNVTVKETNVEQLWLRDSGPLITETSDGHRVGIDMNFNYWGEKIPLWRWHDRTIAPRILAEQNVTAVRTPFTSEGGALEVDGEGTLLVTESSVLNANRNLNATKDDLERLFDDYFGITKTMWLPGAAGVDLTDWHVDLLVRFAPNDTVLLSRPNAAAPKDDVGWRVYREAKGALREATNADGRPLRIVEIEEALTVPYAAIAESGFRAATSYLNYYLPNNAVVVPQFGETRRDKDALEVLRAVWPGREVAGIRLDVLPWFGGAVHCATMQSL